MENNIIVILSNILYNLGFELDKNKNIINKLNFSSYKFNNYFISQLQDFIKSLKDEQIIKEMDNFFSFYYNGGDFGYFKNRYDNYSYRIEYKGEDTKLIWSTMNSYYIKTNDENNKFKPNLGSLLGDNIEFIFEKIFDENKEANLVEISKIEKNFEDENNKIDSYSIKIFNLTQKRKGKNTLENETLEYLLENIKNKLNDFFKSNIGTNFISDFTKNGQLDDFFKKWTKDYFIHKGLKDFLKQELLSYIWDKYGNANIGDYNNILKKAENDKFKDFIAFLRDDKNKINKDKTDEVLSKVEEYLSSKLYKKDEIFSEIKKLSNGTEIILKDLINKNSFLKDIIYKIENSLNTKISVEKSFWEIFRKQTETIIDILSQIEELKKSVWLQKRNIIKSDYVITIDKIFTKNNEKDFLLNLINQNQVNEWIELGMIKDGFKKEYIFEENLLEKGLNQDFKYLPLDTKYLPEKEKYQLLSLFENLENELNGVLIKSENFQGLNSIQSKYIDENGEGKIQTIYIDPPYNTGKNDFSYKDGYKNSSWISLMYDRITLSNTLLNKSGNYFNHIDNNEDYNLKTILNDIFGENNFLSKNIWYMGGKLNTMGQGAFQEGGNLFPKQIEYIYHYRKGYNKFRKLVKIKDKYLIGLKEDNNINNPYLSAFKSLLNNKSYIKLFQDGLFSAYSSDLMCDIDFSSKKHSIKSLYVNRWNDEGIREKIDIFKETNVSNNNKFGGDTYYFEFIGDLFDQIYSSKYSIINYESVVKGFSGGNKPQKLIKRLLLSTTDEKDIVLDYFLGSGTTTLVSHKMGRKYIGIELDLGNFENVVLKKMKLVLSGENSGISKQENWQGGGMFKYMYLENYEDIFDGQNIEEYISKYFDKQEKQIKKEDYENFYNYINNYKINTIETKDYLQSVIYDLGVDEISYFIYDNFVVLQTNKGNFVKFFDKKIETILNKIRDINGNIYLLNNDYQILLNNVSEKDKLKITNILPLSKIYFN